MTVLNKTEMLLLSKEPQGNRMSVEEMIGECASLRGAGFSEHFSKKHAE